MASEEYQIIRRARVSGVLADRHWAQAVTAFLTSAPRRSCGADGRVALYRIVQEGLTNARKHAPGSAVEVTVDGAPERGLSVTVMSWLPADRPAPGGAAGAGLIGLRERAALAGGHIDAAVTGDDRFQLSGWLPWAGR